jgi:hypothetical protein
MDNQGTGLMATMPDMLPALQQTHAAKVAEYAVGPVSLGDLLHVHMLRDLARGIEVTERPASWFEHLMGRPS